MRSHSPTEGKESVRDHGRLDICAPETGVGGGLLGPGPPAEWLSGPTSPALGQIAKVPAGWLASLHSGPSLHLASLYRGGLDLTCRRSDACL